MEIQRTQRPLRKQEIHRGNLNMKDHIIKIIILLIVVLSVFRYDFSFAQDKESLRFAKRIEPIASEYFRIGDYKRALEGYLVLDSILPGEAEYMYRVGICYLNSNLKSKAYPYLEAAYNHPDAPQNIFYELGQAYHYGGVFEKAMIFYDSYLKQLKFSPDADKKLDEIEKINHAIQQCKNGIRLVRDPIINIEVVNLGPNINSEFTDFAPLINKDESLLIFTSKRQATRRTKSDPLTNQYYESIFYSDKSGDSWKRAACIGSPIHHDDIHDAAVGLSPNGTQLFLYQGSDNTFSSKISGNLYQSNYKGGKWSEPKPIIEINSEGWESHASISEDGNLMVFTSDREGGLGGTDIYFSRRKLNKHWTDPENIGGYINTKFDEDGPFIHPDGNKLYFSSKGHNSMGGYDIFYSEYLPDKKRWTRPKNLGYPINTADDDIYFVWSGDGERAYFSSEREDSYGDTDIYLLIRNDEHTPTIVINGFIKDKHTETPVLAEIIIRDQLNNNLIGIFETENSGNYKISLKSGRRYSVTISSGGYQNLTTVLVLEDFSGDTSLSQDYLLRRR